MKIKIVTVAISFIILMLFAPIFGYAFVLHRGDLLFQDLNCGVLCNGISAVTMGVDHTEMSHVAMVVSVKGKEPMVIEAISKGVVLTPLSVFLNRSHDQAGRPRVVVGRLIKPYYYLIPTAIHYAKTKLGDPYDSAFSGKKGKYYCSSLIYIAFKEANHNKPIFYLYPMNFADPKTHQIIPAWKHYFSQLNTLAPQGKLGCNPGKMSRSKKIRIVHWYGRLRQHD